MARRSSDVPLSVGGFSDYFGLTASTDAILTALGYSLAVSDLTLPLYPGDVPWASALAERFHRTIPLLTLDSEAAKREFLIAPVLTEIALQVQAHIHVEHYLNVSERLRGSLDYLVEGSENLIVVEAKMGDLGRGFKQLTTEMVALDQWTDSASPLLYGAVTVGDAWRFGVLDREAKRITQDIDLIPVPADLERLARILLGILQGTAVTAPEAT